MQKEQDSAAEEGYLREPKLAQSDLDSEDDEVLDDGFATPPLHVSPARSHSRVRIGSYRVRLGRSLISCFVFI